MSAAASLALKVRQLQQHVLRLIYPPQCLSCEALTDADFALCGPCWRETPFITGTCCPLCGLPLPGPADPAGATDEAPAALCEQCHVENRPWAAGRAVMLYEGNGRRLILALKHSDRLDLAPSLARWALRRAAPLLSEDSLVLPMPLHPLRLFSRRYNQAALLSAALTKLSGHDHLPDGLTRLRYAPMMEGLSRDARFALLRDAITVTPRHMARLRGRKLLLVDDVMTSGASFDAATRACYAAGAERVCVLALARVAKET